VHYVDIADDCEFVRELKAQVGDSETAIIAGASTVPSVSFAALSAFGGESERLEVVDINISAGVDNNFGLGTIESILSYLGKPYFIKRGGREERVRGWRGLKWHCFPQLGQQRLVANVLTPDNYLLPQRFPSCDFNVSAGVDSSPGMLSIFGLSYLVKGETIAQPLHQILKQRWLMRLLGSDVGVMTVTALSRTTSSDHVLKFHQFSLIGTGGDGPEVPCSSAVLLAEKLLEHTGGGGGGGVQSAAESELNPTLIELEEYWRSMGFQIATQRRQRAFRSPFLEAMGSEGFAALGASQVRDWHCYGGHFEGELRVKTSAHWPLRVLLKLLRFPSAGTYRCRVTVIPTAQETLIFRREFLIGEKWQRLQSEWSFSERFGLVEAFNPLIRFSQELRISAKNGFELHSRRTLPLPDHFSVAKIFAAVQIDSAGSEMSLHVDVGLPLVGALFGYDGTLKCKKQ
jgi:hypothetical protein